VYEWGEPPATAAFGIVAVGENSVAIGRFTDGTRRVAVDFHDADDSDGLVTATAVSGDTGFEPLLAGDSTGAYVVRPINRQSDGTASMWEVARAFDNGPGTMFSTRIVDFGSFVRVNAIIANAGRLAMQVAAVGESFVSVVPFPTGTILTGRQLQPTAGLPMGGPASGRPGSEAFYFARDIQMSGPQRSAMFVLDAAGVVTSSGAPLSVELRTFALLDSLGPTLQFAYADESQGQVGVVTDMGQVRWSKATTGGVASLIATDRCVFWIEEENQGALTLRAALNPP